MQTLIYNKNSDKARVDRNISRRHRKSLSLMVLLVVCLLSLVLLPASTASAGSGDILKNADFELGNLNWWGKWPSGAPGIVAAESCCGNHTPGGTWNAYIQSLNQADAINRAIAIAPEYGIDLPKPSKILAEQMTLDAWDKLAGNMPGSEGAKFGLDPNQIVWVVTLIGDGFWAESNPSGQGGDKIDNITLVISAATGKHIETRVLASADSLPFGN